MSEIKKLRAGIIGATGMVGQRFIVLLENHPYFEVTALAASARSAGKKYIDVVDGRWKLEESIPEGVKQLVVHDAEDIETMKAECDFVFCAVNMKKDEIIALEDKYAKAELPVISNNSANRWTPDVPMLIPEINSDHARIIDSQRKRLGTKRGFIAVKPNCSIQSYVPLITPLLKYRPTEIFVSTYQAISGAGKTFREWPEMQDNVIPYIGGEEEKSEREPLKVWGGIVGDEIVAAKAPVISAQCIRVPVTNGHLATVSVKFENKPTAEEILSAWKDYSGEPQKLGLPSAPGQFIRYFDEPDHPQTGIDRMAENGMGITAGRLREDPIFDYKFVGLSHNTIRGAAGGALLGAELLFRKGYLD